MFWDIAGHFSRQFHFTHWMNKAVPSFSQIFYLPTCKALRSLCDLCDSALKNETPTADFRIKRLSSVFLSSQPIPLGNLDRIGRRGGFPFRALSGSIFTRAHGFHHLAEHFEKPGIAEISEVPAGW